MLMVVLALAACGRRETPVVGPPPAPVAVAPAPMAAPAPAPAPEEDPEHPLPDASIYDLELALRDQHARGVGLDVFRGQPTLVVMFYGSCPAACPRIIDEILDLEAALPPERRARLRVLLVSFDAARDTPAALADLAKKRELPADRWLLAAANDRDARQLAAVLGVRYRRLDDGEFFHTSVFTLVDQGGRPAARVEGLGRDKGPILSRLR
jgi:protein SCO1/2